MKKLLAGLLGVTLVVGLSLIPFSQNAYASVVLFDDFDFENGSVGTLNYSSFLKWNVSNGTVDLIGNGYFDFYPGNGLYVDLDGSTWNAGVLTSKAIFYAGIYDLKFDLGGSTRDSSNTVTVSLGSGYSEDFTLGTYAPLATVTRNITIPSGTTGQLIFDHAGADNMGLILDNVKLTLIPEPATLSLLGLGLLGLTGIRRKRKKS